MKSLIIIIGLIVFVFLGYLGYRSFYSSPVNSSLNSRLIATNKVEIKNSSFVPANATVNVGKDVTFTNNDSITHTIIADDNSFSSGPLDPGASFTRVFSSAGIVTYRCSIHPSMTGKIEVK